MQPAPNRYEDEPSPFILEVERKERALTEALAEIKRLYSKLQWVRSGLLRIGRDLDGATVSHFVIEELRLLLKETE
jgi:hypothetical protein